MGEGRGLDAGDGDQEVVGHRQEYLNPVSDHSNRRGQAEVVAVRNSYGQE